MANENNAEEEQKAQLLKEFEALKEDAKKCGLDASAPDQSASVDVWKKELEALKELIKAEKDQTQAPEDHSQPEAAEKVSGKPSSEMQSQENTGITVQTLTGQKNMTVNGQDNTQDQPDEDWIAKKRAFWQDYAATSKLELINDAAADQESKSFAATLKLGDKALGDIKYTSPTNAAVSKDASFELYRGLATDAATNNLSITFGQTMDDTQKAMLMAACLKTPYPDGSGKHIEMVNTPKIDPNAEYFQKLPPEVQSILKQHLENQQKINKARERARQGQEKENKTGEHTANPRAQKKANETNVSSTGTSAQNTNGNSSIVNVAQRKNKGLGE
jgi:hypothetical protein